MFRKIPAFVVVAFSSCTIIYSQQSPEPVKKPAQPEKTAVWTMGALSAENSYLGIEPQEVTKENFSKFGLREVRGVVVEKVVENSPAANAGLLAGDVIVKFDDEEVTSVRKLTRLVSETAPDHQLKITVLRGGDERELTATMGKRQTPSIFNGTLELSNLPNIQTLPNVPRVEVLTPNADGKPLIWQNDAQNTLFFGASRQIGVGVSSLTRQLGEYFGVPEGKGLLVTSVRENSPAEKSGLKAGDVIVEADSKEIRNNADLVRALNENKEGGVRVTFVRDRNRQTVAVTPEKIKTNLAPLFDETSPQSGFQFKMPLPQTAPYPSTVPAPPRQMRRVL